MTPPEAASVSQPGKSAGFCHAAALGDSLEVGVMVISPDRTLLFSNDLAHKFLDFPRDLVSENLSINKIVAHMVNRGDFGPSKTGDDMERHKKNVQRFFTADSKNNRTSLITPPNGRTLEIKPTVCPDNNMIVTIDDISNSYKKDEVFKIALELGKSGYFTYNFDTQKIDFSSKYLKGLLSEEEYSQIKENGFWSLTHEDDFDSAKKAWEQSIQSGANYDNTVRIKVESFGLKWFRFYARPQKTETGRLVNIVCFFEDVTEDLNLQEDLRKAKDNAEKTLQAQNNFLARLSHEVRTPMNAVIGITDALVQHSPEPAILSKLKLIQSSADSIMNILEGTLSHNKLDADKLMLDPQPGNPRETVETICALWSPQAKKNGTTIKCHIEAKTPDKITFDRFRDEQCLNNLLSNAVKFTPNGQIHVILTLIGEDGPKPRLVLAVKDTGIGMTEEQQSRIFDAYAQADNTISSRFGGTGLGMNIAKSIIELMGGSITVKSEIGKGTIFALSLPVEIEKKKMPVPSATEVALVDHLFTEKEKEETPYSNLKILVADDNPTNHLVVESLLESVVGTIYKANNGQEVLDILDVQDIDIVLMDIHMPVMDGIESTLAIRSSPKHWSDILIIAVTADPQYQQLRLCKNIGMDESLAKPIKLTTMLEAFDRVLTLDRSNAPYKEIYKPTG